MDMKRERLLWGSALAVLVLVVVFLLASSSDIPAAGDLIQWVIALSILMVSVTIAFAIGALCLRLLWRNDSAATTSHVEGQFPILAGTIALFGILITGVFVITTFRVETGARQEAAAAAHAAVTEVVPSVAQTMLPRVVTDLLRQMDDEFIDRLIDANLTEAVLRADSARHTEELPEITGDNGAPTLEVGMPYLAQIVPGESWRFRLDVPTEGIYSIDAMGVDEFDPFIYVYAKDDGGSLELIEANDDGGEGLDSRVEMNLAEGVIYVVEVEGYFGSAGQCTMLVSLIPN